MSERKDDQTPIDADVGDETDVQRTAQTINARAIDALVMSEEPLGKRLEALKGMKTELQARLARNKGDDLAPLAEQVDRAIDRLSSAGGPTGTRSPIKTY